MNTKVRSAWLVAAVAVALEGQEAPPTVGVPRVVEATLARSDSARARFSVQESVLLFDRVDARGWTRLWTVHRDGSFERCLTCDAAPFVGHHTGAGRWHPSGELIVFLAERPARGKPSGDLPPTPFLATPGRNRGNDLWLASADGKRFWNLTNSANRGGNRVHVAAFAHEGNRLAWSEREATGGSVWGGWVVQVGRFHFRRATPHLSDVTGHRLDRAGFVEVMGFAADDRGLDIGATPSQPPFAVGGQDLYRRALGQREAGDRRRGQSSGPSTTAWTETPTAWDGHLAFSRDGAWAVFASTQDMPPRPPAQRDEVFLPPTELWIADPDGDVLQRLTGFNDPTSPHFLGEPAHVGPAAWTPEGNALLVTVTPRSTGRPALFRLDLKYEQGVEDAGYTGSDGDKGKPHDTATVAGGGLGRLRPHRIGGIRPPG